MNKTYNLLLERKQTLLGAICLLRIEDKQIDAAIKAISKVEGETSVRVGTIKEMALNVISESDGLSSKEVGERIGIVLGVTIPRTSLTPQISRLKRMGLVKYEKGLWKTSV